MCYLQLEEGHIFSRRKIPALVLVLFGLIVALFGVIFLIVDFDKVDTCSHGGVMEYCNNFNFNNDTINDNVKQLLNDTIINHSTAKV